MTAKIRHKEKNCYSHFRCNYTPTKKKIKNKITISIKDSCNKRPLDYTITNLPGKDYSDFVATFSALVNISINTKNKIVFGISWTLTDNPTADDTDPDCTQLSNTPEDNSTPEHP